MKYHQLPLSRLVRVNASVIMKNNLFPSIMSYICQVLLRKPVH